MRKALIAFCAVAVLVPVIFATSAGAGQGVKAPKECDKPINRPHMIVLGCADFGVYLNSIHWNKWKSDKAKGDGYLQINDCVPDCASGHFDAYPVDIKLKKPKDTKCGNKHYNMFRKAFLEYTGKKPPHKGNYKENKLYCD